MLQLRDIMTTDVLTVSPDASLRSAAALLAAHHIGGVPVVAGDTVVGVLSASDILAFALAAREGDGGEADAADDWEAPPWESEDEPPARYFTELWAAGGADVVSRIEDPTLPGTDPLAAATVADAMTPRLLALPPTADASAAAALMRTAEVHRVLVVADGMLLGLVTSMDLVRAVADHRLERRRLVFDRPTRPSRPSLHERGTI